MKNILYISYDGMTDQLGQSQVLPYLRELTKEGYHFHLLSVEKKERLEKTGPHIRRLMEESGIQWTTIPFSTRPPLFSKLYDQWKLDRTAIQICRKEKIDMVHCRSYVPAAAGLKISQQFNIPFLFDMRGFWVDERVDSGLWKLKNPFYKLLYQRYKKKEKKYFDKASHVISLTHTGKDELVKNYGVPPGKISVIPCCADLEHFDYTRVTEDQDRSVRQTLGISKEHKVLSYLGSLGGWYLTEEMLDFFAAMKKKDPESIFLMITHDTPASILEKAKAKGIDPASLRIQPATRNEVPLFLSVSEWNIFFIKDAYSKKASSPTKQGEVMAMGIPIICNDIGDTGKIIQDTGAGVLVNSFDTAGYLQAYEQLQGLKRVGRQKIREGAKKYYDLEQGVILYKQVYSQLLN
jgi:glycosyltransferase involved in cell wall biosynthesis